ncbi:hypothetical protein [Agromyces humi]|uniref:hypothetical protein n=1 Tax=Agromyces humi TaxID=1766800 RepID=UPI0013590418|nr:hypothetical protein [Agromyces humi]
MSDEQRPDDTADRRPASVEAYRGLAAAYALDALDADERAAFERVLADSAELRDEVDAYARSGTRPWSIQMGRAAMLDTVANRTGQ